MQTIPQLYERIEKGKTLKDLTREFERNFVEYALMQTRYNQTETAKNIGVSRDKLRRILRCKN